MKIMTEELTQKQCVPCKTGTPPLQAPEIAKLMPQLSPDWKVIDSHHLERQIAFPDFKTALAFTNKIGALAEQEGHHPDLLLGWGKVKVTLFTHKIKGLSENDFILAAKIDTLHNQI